MTINIAAELALVFWIGYAGGALAEDDDPFGILIAVFGAAATLIVFGVIVVRGLS